MFFWGCNKNEVFKDSKKLSRNIDKKLNVKEKDMCYFYRERERERERESEISVHLVPYFFGKKCRKYGKTKVRNIFGVITTHWI